MSLAAVLAIPTTVEDGSPFPDRDLLVFVTCGVIVGTLLLQGLTLPAVVRWARLPADEARAVERRKAEKAATHAGLAAMDEEARRLGTDPELVRRLRAEYEEHAAALASLDGTAASSEAAYDALRLALLAHKRAAVVQLRDERHIDDIVLREVQAQLDAEEVRLLRPAAEE
ncbi:cation:proton antiporter family protein [Motilibacter deserti]|uniref:hypothetical protein n=1 Tax=Motilibacter deserti TaxID=2714956 RepID=UPI001E344FA1|nr:hypothetical protein [Motilibacter deserti]